MPNERLRATLLERGLTPAALGEDLGVDHKTVERWISGRLPYRRHRFAAASRLGVDEAYLWPDALVPGAGRGGFRQRGPGDLPAPFGCSAGASGRGCSPSAEREIGVLVYSGLFLAEDAGVQKIIAEKARAGVRVRFLLGDPDSPQVAERGSDEGVDDAMAARIRNVLVAVPRAARDRGRGVPVPPDGPVQLDLPCR